MKSFKSQQQAIDWINHQKRFDILPVSKSFDISAMLYQARRKLGLSQEKLAHKMGVCFATMNRWENGRCFPQRIHLRQIKAILAGDTHCALCGHKLKK